MEADKRRFVRKRTDQLVYAELGPDNGSILLNLSEGGCSFQSIAPVREERMRFTVSVGDGCKLEGDAQVIWSDIAKKTGGLRFLNPSQELQEQVRKWLERSPVTEDGRLDPKAVGSQANRRRRELREEARAAAKLARKQGPKKIRAKPDVEVKGQLPTRWVPEANTATVQVASNASASANEATSQMEDRNVGGTWRGIAGIVLAALVLIALGVYRRELGHRLMSLGSSLAGDEQKAKAGAPAAAEVPAVPEQAGADAKPAVMSEGKDGSRETDQGGGAAPIGKEQIVPATKVSMATAKRSASQQASTSEGISSLWRSVENGDIRAEVLLADRYIRGEGVPQSCAQARVLLEAAAKRGSAEAQQKLDKLVPGGCP
jgi:PilZ domain